MLIRSVILYRYSTTLGVIFLFLIDDGLEIVASLAVSQYSEEVEGLFSEY